MASRRFPDWLRDEERRVRLCQIMERYEELGPKKAPAGAKPTSINGSPPNLMTEFERLSTMTDRDERWKRFQKISQELNRLQRARARASAAALQQAKASQLPHSKPTCVQHLGRTQTMQLTNSLTHPSQTHHSRRIPAAFHHFPTVSELLGANRTKDPPPGGGQ